MLDNSSKFLISSPFLYNSGFRQIAKRTALETQVQYNFEMPSLNSDFIAGFDYRNNGSDSGNTLYGRNEQDDDFEIFHNGSNSNTYFKDKNNTGGTIFLTSHFIGRNAADTETTFEAMQDGPFKAYYNGNNRLETTDTGVQINTTSNGNLVITDGGSSGGLIVNGDARIEDNLTVSETANFAGNTVQITGNTVTANNFRGTADRADDIRVDGLGDSSGPHYLLLQNGTSSGHYTKARVDAGISYNSSSNTLSVAGDLVAFASDDRLKTNKQQLTGALDKVCSLSGFTFNFNETAGELGFNTDHTYVGVSAQDVQKVLPEAVYPAPASDKYITVQYEKIVPLLIEAIKELSDKVSALEDKLNN